MKSIRSLALPMLALALLASAPAQLSAATPSASVLPSNTLFYMSMPSVDEFKARLDKTSFGQIRKDPAFKEFIDQIGELMEKANREFERETKMKLQQLLDIPSGEVAIAVVKPRAKPLAVVGFVDFGKSEDTVDQLLDKLEDALDAENADRKVQEYKNTRIVVYKMPGADQQQGPFKPGFSYFVKETQFVVATDVSALESILDNWGGDAGDSFANDRIFKVIMQKCKSENEKPVFQWFFNPVETLKTVVQFAPAEQKLNIQMGMAVILPASGLSDFKGMGGTADYASGDFESVSKSMMYVNQPPQGLLNLFRFPATDLSPPQWVSEKTQAYVAMNWDIAAAYDAVESIVDLRGAGTLEGLIENVANNPNGPGIHLKKDVIDQLNGRFHIINQGVDEIGQAVPKFLVSIGVKNTKSVQDLFAKVIKGQGAPIQTRDFRGETIMEISNPPVTIAMSVFNSAIVITSNVSLLEQIIRGDRTQDALVDSAAYKQIAKEMPAKTSMLSFQNTDEQIRVIYDAARKGEFGNADIPAEAKDLLESLPPFEALQKYLPITGGYTVPDDNGVMFVNLSQAKK